MSVPAFTPAAPPPQPSSAATGATGAAARASSDNGSPSGFDTVLAAVGGQNDTPAPPSRASKGKDAAKAGDTTKAGKGDDSAKAKTADDADAANDAAATTPASRPTPDALVAMLLPTAAAQVPPTAKAVQGDAAANGGQPPVAPPALPPAGVTAAATAASAAGAALTKLAADTAADPAETSDAPPQAAAFGVAVDAASTGAKAPNGGQTAAATPTPTATSANVAAANPTLPAPAPAPAAAAAPAPPPPASAPTVPQPPVVATDVTTAATAAAAQAAAAPLAPPKVDPAPAAGAKDKAQVAKTEGAAGAQPDAALNVSAAAKPAAASQAAIYDATKSGADNADPGAPAPDAKTDAGAPTTTPAALDTAANATPASLTHAAATEVRASPQTVATLAAQIAKKLDGRMSRFDVQLDPAGLGKVNVRIEIGGDGRMSASMSFDNPQAAAELKARAGELQRALAQSGFDLSGGMSFDVAGGSAQDRQAQNQDTNSGAAFRGRAFQAALDTTADVAPGSQAIFRQSSVSGVDIRI